MARAVGIDLGTTNSVVSTLEGGDPEGHATLPALKLSDAAFNAVNQQIRSVDALSVAVLENRQVTTKLSGGEHPESAFLSAFEDPLRLLILRDVCENLLASPRIDLTALPERRIDT